MKTHRLLTSSVSSIIFLIALSLTCLCQQPQQEKKKPASSDPSSSGNDVVRLSTTLVQIDTVVTDKQGHHINNLKAEDFVVLEDGRPQKITHFSYITGQPGSASPVSASSDGKKVTPSSPAAGQQNQPPRMIALVVDDMGLTFENLAYVRTSLEKFVDSTMQPGDSIAIIRTSSGMGALQQFTSDKRLLHLAIDRIQWKGFSHSSGLFAPAIVDPRAPTMGGGSNNDDLDQFREDLFAVGTLGALNFVVRGLRELPGRKSVLLISQNLPLFRGSKEKNDKIDRIADALERLIDLANRASVVIYAMDARGLSAGGFTASDRVTPGEETGMADMLSAKRRAYIDSQGGMSYLAQQTGGIFIHDTNDLRAGMGRVLEEQNGFYLLGYQPEEKTFQRPETGPGKAKPSLPYHRLTVRVNQSDLHVRSRTGFFAMTNEEARVTERTAEQQIHAVLYSPFAANNVHLRLTSLFTSDPASGSVVRSMLHIDANDLSFKKETDAENKESYSAVVDLVAVTYDENGNVIDQVSRTDTLRLKPQAMEKALTNGIVCTLDVPVKKPGAYQLRLIMRDNASERIGSAAQFIDVPDLTKKRLALSGIAVSGYDPKADIESTTTSQEESDPRASPAVRQFHQGMALAYVFEIYNARVDKAGHGPSLVMQSRLFRDGKEIYASAITPVLVKPGADLHDLQRIVAAMSIQLAGDQPSGQYSLQVIVTDGKNGAATQWTDFEVIKR